MTTPWQERQRLIRERADEIGAAGFARTRGAGGPVRPWQRAEHEAQAAAEVEAGASARLAAEVRRLADGVEAGDVAAMTAYVEALGVRHAIAITWRAGSSMPEGVRGFAVSRQRKITVPFIRTLDDFAVALHEVGHTLTPCPGTGTHSHRDAGGCVSCEVAAWQKALELVPEGTRAAIKRAAAAHLEGLGTFAGGPMAAWREAAKMVDSGWRARELARIERAHTEQAWRIRMGGR